MSVLFNMIIITSDCYACGVQVAYCVIGLLDIIIVCRWNVKMGIPDHMFVIGDEAVTDVIGRLQLMPFMVLSARLCPPGIEGTVFAFLMSLSNFGATCASWAGALLLQYMCGMHFNHGHLWLAVYLASEISPPWMTHVGDLFKEEISVHLNSDCEVLS